MLRHRDALGDPTTLAISRDVTPTPSSSAISGETEVAGPAPHESRAASNRDALAAPEGARRDRARAVAEADSNLAPTILAPSTTVLSATSTAHGLTLSDNPPTLGPVADTAHASGAHDLTASPTGQPTTELTTRRTTIASAPISPAFSAAALATTQPQQIDFTANNLPVFGSNATLSFALPSFLYQQFNFSTGVSFAGFGVSAGISLTGGIKGSVALSAGQFTPDYPITIDPGVAPFVLDGQVFSIDPTLVSTNDAQFSLSLPQANANLDFGLQASANLTFSFPGIPIGISLPFIGFIGTTIHIPSVSIGFHAGSVFKLANNTTINIPGDGTVTVSELQSSVVSSGTVSGFDSLPTLVASGSTAPFLTANVDLVKLLAQEVPDPFAVLAGSQSFAGVASLSYQLFGLPLSASLWLSEAVTVTPIGIVETVTDTLNGQSQSGPLGTSFNFTAPSSGNGVIPFSISYGLALSVTTSLELDGALTLAVTGPSLSASVLGISAGVGPLGNFNLLNVGGKLLELYSNTTTETLTSTGMVDVQNLSMPVVQTIGTSTGPVNITQPATDLTITAAGTVTGSTYGVNTGTLSSAMVNDYGLITASQYGIELKLGGTVNVDSGGRIKPGTSVSSNSAGIMAPANPVNAVVNSGAITGFATGVSLAGGSVTNWTGATISASSYGVVIAGAGAKVVNDGSIAGLTPAYRGKVHGEAVSLTKGGSLYNGLAGVIDGGAYGVIAGAGVSVTNHCTIIGGGTAIRGAAGGQVTNLAGGQIKGGALGVSLGGTGANSVTNDATATISGLIGVAMTGAYTTLINYGTITGTTAGAELYGTVSNTLELAPGSSLTGGVRLNPSATTAVTLMAGAGGVGTLAGLGAGLPMKGTITIDPGAAWYVSGNFTGVTVAGLNPNCDLDDTAISFIAGERVVLNRQTDVLGVFAAGNPTTPVGTIQLYGALGYAPGLTSDGKGGVVIGFYAQKFGTVSANSGEVDLTPTGSFFESNVTISSGVTVSANYYGAYKQTYGVHASQERATLTNQGVILGNHIAVDFASGGVVTNAASATISGNIGVVLGSNSPATKDTVTLTNAGTVKGAQTGAYLTCTGTVTNMTSGQISGAVTGVQLQAGGVVNNLGTVTGGQAALKLSAGGFAYNVAGALLTGKSVGVAISGAYGKVVNWGSIDASFSGAGVDLYDGGLVVNETGMIDGATIGVKITGAAGNIANASTIHGIQLVDGGEIINGAKGTVTAAGVYAVSFYNPAGPVAAYLHNMGRVDGVQAWCGETIVNAGTIDGVGLVGDVAGPGSITVGNTGVVTGSAWGMRVLGGAIITNGDAAHKSAQISGTGGIYAGTGGYATVTNFGAINGTGGRAVQFSAATDRLIVEAGSTFVGAVKGGGGTLELAGGIGTISGLGASGTLSGAVAMSFGGFGAYAIDAGAAWTLSGAASLPAKSSLAVAGVLTNSGTLIGAGAAGVTLTGAGSVINGAASNTTAQINGPIGVYAGASSMATVTNFGTVDGTGGVAVSFKSAGDRLIAEAGSTWIGQALGGGGTLELASGTGTIAGLGVTGTISGAEAMTFSGFGAYGLDKGSTWTLAGAARLAAGQTLTNAGALNVTGALTDHGRIIDSGSITLAAGATISGPGAAMTIANAGIAQIQGLVSNAGSISVNGSTKVTALSVLAAGATLSGGGTVALGGSMARIIGVSSAATLTNVSDTIKGQGFIGVGALTLNNEAAGVIEATGSLHLNTAGKTLVNAGMIEAVGGGSLAILSTTVANTGTILAAGGLVNIQNSAILGGALATTGAGVLKINTGSSLLDGTASTVSLAGVLDVVSQTTLTAQGVVSNAGKISLGSGKLIVGSAGLTLSGGGQVSLSNASANIIIGATASSTLTNVNDRISGAGQLGDGSMILINQAGGVITDTASLGLTINTGSNTIQNAGTISGGGGGVTIKSAIVNSGEFLAASGTLSVNGVVTGAGKALINGGTLAIGAHPFAQSVTFTGTTGVLRLADSHAFTGAVAGLSKTGTDWLDLVDISFTSGTTTASYAGTTAGGVLTVTDGAHTAKITLTGNYTKAVWSLSAAVGGGTQVADPTPRPAAGGQTTPTQAFAQSMAGLGASTATAHSALEAWRSPPVLLVAPRSQAA